MLERSKCRRFIAQPVVDCSNELLAGTAIEGFGGRFGKLERALEVALAEGQLRAQQLQFHTIRVELFDPRNCLGEFVNRVLPLEQAGEGEQSRKVIGMRGQRLPQRLDGLLGATEQVFQPGDGDPSRNVVRIFKHELPRDCERLLSHARADLCFHQFLAKLLQIRPELEGPGESFRREARLAIGQTARAEIAPAFKVPWIRGDDVLEDLRGLAGLISPRVDHRLQATRFHPRQCCSRKQLIGLVELSEADEQPDQLDARDGIGRCQRDGLANVRQRIIELQSAQVEEADEQPQSIIVRVACDRAARSLEGARGVAAAGKFESLLGNGRHAAHSVRLNGSANEQECRTLVGQGAEPQSLDAIATGG
ncbi:MAG: hypothetical protein ABI422_02185 [Sphingomicrobium sp.]